MIIFCHLLNDRSGSPAVLSATIRALSDVHPGVLYVGSDGRGTLESVDVPVRRYWYRRSRYKLVTLFTYLVSQLALYRALSSASDIPKDAIVFVNTLLPVGAMWWGHRTARKVIVHVHEVSIKPAVFRRMLTGCASRYADQLIYVSKDHLSRLPISASATRMMFNPVHPDFSELAQEVPYAPRRTGSFEVLMLASLKSYKGVDEFICLARSLRHRRDIQFTLVLNAEALEVSSLQNRCLGLENIVLHHRTNDPSDFYKRADLVLNLSRPDEWIETFGLTLVEAMTFGVPVIAPPVGGPAEIVTHGREGYCIDSRDGAALQGAVLKLADNADLAIAMSQAARTRARYFSFDSYKAEICKIISQVQAS